MYSYQIMLPTESMIAGTTKRFEIFLDVDKTFNKKIDATGIMARFAIADYINTGSTPFVSKACDISVQQGGLFGTIGVSLSRPDTILLSGKYIYQVSIKAGNIDEVWKGILEIAENQDKGAFG